MNDAETIIKEKALKAISALPNDASYDDIMEQILFLSKVESALKERAQGKFLTQEEVETRLKRKWL
ncbi:MAG: hypothetical protein NZM06_01800 [Chloroherpetonaceae bacterium]|nr:hypothetical protein [Chloroherpetonaceae bacterium]